MRGSLRVAAVLLLLAAQVARADDTAALTEAKAHFEAGSALFDVGRFDEAVREFRAAYQLSKKPDLLYNIGQASMRRGDAARAIEAYTEYLRDRPDAPDRVSIEATIENLKPQTGHVRVTGVATGETVEVDGLAVGAAPLAEPVLVTIGKRKVLARGADDGVKAQTEVVVLPGQEVAVDLAPKPLPAPPPPPEHHESTSRRWSKPGLAIGGAGAVAAIAGAVLLGLVPSTVSDARAATSSDQFSSLKDRATNFRNAGAALLAVGGAALLVGAALVVVELRRGPRAHAWLAPSPGGIVVGGSF